MKPRQKVDGINQNKGVSKDVPNSKMYTELRELDLRVEQYTNRKKAEICDMNQLLDLQTRTLRLHLYNQHHNQNCQDESNRTPAWSFFIYGQFLDQEQVASETDKKSMNRWTMYMATIQIEICDPQNPESPVETFQWQRNRHVGAHKECVEIHRLGSKPMSINVRLVREFAPEYMLVSGNLASAINLKAGTRGKILRKLWSFTRAHSTPDVDDPSIVHADDDLFKLFGERKLDMSSLGRRMDPFLKPPEVVTLRHNLVLDGPSPCTPTTYDMEVAWSLKPHMLQLPAFLERFDARPLIEVQDRRITECMSDFKGSHKQYQVLMGFASNPVEYVHKLVAASATEVRHKQTEKGEQVVHQIAASENFQLPWAQEAAIHFLTKPEGQHV